MNDKNKLSYILSLYYRWEFIEIVERTNGDGDCIKETILERDFRKNLHELNYKELFKRNLYVVEILSTTNSDYATRTILVVREDKNYESK